MKKTKEQSSKLPQSKKNCRVASLDQFTQDAETSDALQGDYYRIVYV